MKTILLMPAATILALGLVYCCTVWTGPEARFAIGAGLVKVGIWVQTVGR